MALFGFKRIFLVFVGFVCLETVLGVVQAQTFGIRLGILHLVAYEKQVKLVVIVDLNTVKCNANVIIAVFFGDCKYRFSTK